MKAVCQDVLSYGGRCMQDTWLIGAVLYAFGHRFLGPAFVFLGFTLIPLLCVIATLGKIWSWDDAFPRAIGNDRFSPRPATTRDPEVVVVGEEKEEEEEANNAESDDEITFVDDGAADSVLPQGGGER